MIKDTKQQTALANDAASSHEKIIAWGTSMTNSLDLPQKTKKKKGVAKPISLNRIKIKNLNSAVAVAAVALACLASSGIATAGEVSQVKAVGTHVIGYPTTHDTQFATCHHVSGARSCRGAYIPKNEKDRPDGGSSEYSFMLFPVAYTDSDFFPGVSELHKERAKVAFIASFSDIIEMWNPRRITYKEPGYVQNSYKYYVSYKVPPTVTIVAHELGPIIERSCPSGGGVIKERHLKEVITKGYRTTDFWGNSYDVPTVYGDYSVQTINYECNKPPSIPGHASFTIDEDTVGTHTVAITDPDAGDTHTIEVTAQPANGKLAISGNKVTYTPNKDWNGTETFKVRVKDAAGAVSGIQTVTVTVKPVNDAPVIAATSSLTVNEDTAGVVTVAISDPDAGDTHTVVITAQPPNGKLSISGNKVTYTPNKDWNGTDIFKLQVKDRAGAVSGVQTVTVTVKPVNDAPVIAATSSLTVNEDTAGVVTVAISDPDAGDTHTVVITAQPPNGKLSISGNKVTYTPNKDWNGTDTFRLQVKDRAGAVSGVQTVTVTVKPVNDAPAIPAATTLTIDEDSTGTHTVVITDPDLGMPSDSHTLEVTQQPSNGTVTSAKSGNNFVLTYKPNKDWNGTDTVKVRVKDAAGVSSGIQTLTITVKPVNDAPTIPATAAYAIDEDTTGSHVVVISDVDFNMPGDSHTIEVMDNPKNGTVTSAKSGNNFVLTYKPKKDWNGTETFKVRVKDAAGAVSGIQTVTVTVKPVNDAPAIPAATTLVIDEDTTGTHTVVITDPDLGMPSDSHTLEVTQQPSNGTVTSAKSGNNFVLTYKPKKDWNGTDTVKVRVKDAAGAVSGVQTLTITVKPVNDAPTIPATAAYAIDEDTTGSHVVVISDVDFNMPGDSHTIEVTDNPKNGTVTTAKEGTNYRVTYKPNKDWNGTETLKVRVKDAAGAVSGIQTVTVTVKPINDAPAIPAATTLTIDEDTTGTHTVVITDPDLGMPSDSHTLEVTQQPSNGTVTSAKSGNNFVLTYKPKKDWNGTDTVKVRVKDAAGVSSGIQTLTITVKPVNDAPTIPATAAYAIDEDTTGSHAVVITDADFNMPGDSHTIEVTDKPKNGTVTTAKEGTNYRVTYKPNKDWNGTETFKVRVKDAAGAVSGIQTVTVTVKPINDAPIIAANSTITTDEDTTGTYTVVITDVDFDMPHDSHTIETTQQPKNGSITFVKNGRNYDAQYTPNLDWNGTDTLKVRVKDEAGAYSNEQLITVTVNPVNDAAILAARQEFEIDEDTELYFTVEVEDVDFNMPGDSHTIQVLGMYNSTVTVISGGEKNNPTHKIHVVPNKDWNGTERLHVQVTDEAGELSNWQDVIIVVRPVNDAPVAVEVLTDVIQVDQYNASQWHDIKVEDVDLPNHDNHSFSISGNLQGGTVEFDGYRLRYIADGGFYGDMELTITATDEAGESVSNTFKLFVRELLWQETIRLPSVAGVFMGRNNRFPIMTEPYAKKLDEYELRVLSASSLGLQVDGEVIEIGSSVTYNDGLYQTRRQELGLPIGSNVTGQAGEAILGIYPADFTEPAKAYRVEFYTIETELKADTFEVISLLQPIDIKVQHKGEQTCRITLMEGPAESHDALNDPVCLLEWVEQPDEATLATWRDSNGLLLPALKGRAHEIGTQPVSFDLYMYNGKKERVLVEHVSTSLNVLDPNGAVKFKPAEDKPEVMKSVELYKLQLVQDDGPTCSPTTNRDFAIAQAASHRTFCLITWGDVPSTLADPLIDSLPRLHGLFESLGEAKIEWHISIFTNDGEEVDLGTQVHKQEVVAPALPTITVESKHKYGDNYVVPMNESLLGYAHFESEPADLLVSISSDDVEINSEVYYAGNIRAKNRILRVLDADHSGGLYSQSNIKLQAAYDLLPASNTEMQVKVISSPSTDVEPYFELDTSQVLDTEELPLVVSMINRRLYDREYRPEYGQWDVTIHQRISSVRDGERMVQVSDTQRTNMDGQTFFSIDMSKIEGTSARLFAVAKLVHEIPEYEREAESRGVFVSVLFGSGVEGEVTSRKYSGESIYNARFQFVPDRENLRATRAMGETRWHISADGGETWEITEPNPNRTLSRKFEKGIYLIKATSYNKFSGAEFDAAEVELVVYDKPTLKLDGPTRLMIGDTANLRVIPYIHGEERSTEDFSFSWSTDKGETWVEGSNEYSVTQDEVGTYQLRVRVKEHDAPSDDSKAWTELRVNPRFYPIRGPKIGLRVPRKMEVGKEYVLTATARSRVAQMKGEIVGEFVMPDGKRYRGTEITYTPTEEDREAGRVPVLYEAWFAGFEDDGGFNSRSTNSRIWEYVWPGFELGTPGTIRFAPTRITLAVSQSVPTPLESPNYEWRIPEGAELLRDRGSRIEFIIPKGGKYDLGVKITDGRGNESDASIQLDLEDAPKWNVDNEVKYSNEEMRAPVTVSYRPSFSGGHPLDRVAKKRFYHNGELFKENGFTAKRELPAGNHTIAVEMESRYGQIVRDEIEVNVEPNIPPECTVELLDLGSKWRVMPECEDEDGIVRRLNWTSNGIESSGSKYKTYIKSRIRETIEVVVVAVDDSGDESEPRSVILEPADPTLPAEDGPAEEDEQQNT